ncbi:NAD(P)H-binding protein, partial [Desulfovibrio sp.]|uniref:NAD(P)H-binding protein n=1 Tax=Desulfovibrio sp. TaxID=885 RepID=UPI0023C1880A
MEKKVVLIGASGFVGMAILRELLDRGWQVRALVREPQKISLKNPALTVEKVDVSDEKRLEKALS